MRVRDLDFNLTYVRRYDTKTKTTMFAAFNCEDEAIDFMEWDAADMNAEEAERYEYDIVDGDMEIEEEE